jgi:hypothetical protein
MTEWHTPTNVLVSSTDTVSPASEIEKVAFYIFDSISRLGKWLSHNHIRTEQKLTPRRMVAKGLTSCTDATKTCVYDIAQRATIETNSLCLTCTGDWDIGDAAT